MERDKNGDGRLSLSESFLDESTFAEHDESQNGELSLGEFNSYWQTLRPGKFYPNLSYGKESKRQTLDLYLPEKLHSEMPLVIWIHGGSWRSGSKDANPFRTLTSHGFLVASVNYRLTPEARFPAQIEDIEKAVSWLEEEIPKKHGIKVGQVSLIGLSAGGHLALLMGAKAEVDQVVSFAAPVDLSQAAAVEAYRPTLEQLVGSPLESRLGLLRQASPLHQIGAEQSEYLLFHGTDDRRVPHTETLDFAEAVAGKHGSVEVCIVPRGSHSLVGGPRGWLQILNFLRTEE